MKEEFNIDVSRKIISFDDIAGSLGRIEFILVAIYNNGITAANPTENC